MTADSGADRSGQIRCAEHKCLMTECFEIHNPGCHTGGSMTAEDLEADTQIEHMIRQEFGKHE